MIKEKVGILYIPVLHKGYFDLLAELEKENVSTLFIASDEILSTHEELDYIHRKDRIRALPTEEVISFLRAKKNITVEALTAEAITALKERDIEIHVPREDINEYIVGTYFKETPVVYHNVFLRWNKNNIEEENDVTTIELSGFQKTILHNVLKESEKSADWWRQVGAALVKDGEVVALTHNEHMPDEELPNIFGDARSLYKKGVNINYVTSAHAELGVIGEAAKNGVVTEGAELYLTDFPCPYCARLIAKAGIKKLYYLKGYGVLDGENFLKEMGIETHKVSI